MKTGKLYTCIYCSYSADKKVSLNRHMRMHSAGPTPPPTSTSTSNINNDDHNSSNHSTSKTIPSPSCTPEAALERFCQDCDIQFSSIKTFRVHKQYYCSTRHVLKTAVASAVGTPGTMPNHLMPGNTNESPSSITKQGQPSAEISSHHLGGKSPSPGSPIPPPQPFLLLPTNPVIVLPYNIIQGATMLPPNLMPPHNSIVVLPNGSVQLQSLNNPNVAMSTTKSSSAHVVSASSLSPNPIFNDPKEIIKNIDRRSSCGRSESDCPVNVNTSNSSSNPSPHSNHNNEGNNEDYPNRSSRSTSRRRQMSVSWSGDESAGMPAIDLTLQPKKSTALCSDEEKENRHGANSSNLPSSATSDSAQEGLHLRETYAVSSPSRSPSVGSNSGGCKRPSSASMSSSCSTPPNSNTMNVGELNKVNNGVLSRGKDLMMMNARELAAMSRHKKGKGKISGAKFPSVSPTGITSTQLPGGAILTSASSSSTGANPNLSELFMSNPLEVNETLMKLQPHLFGTRFGGNSSSSPPPLMLGPGNVNPALLHALTPEVAMKLLDPSYIASLHHSLTQQQNNIGPPLKRGVSKCVECDIVFYKYENYLVHKEHYCSSRLSDADVRNGNNDSRNDEEEDANRISPNLVIVDEGDKLRMKENASVDSRASSSPCPPRKSSNGHKKSSDASTPIAENYCPKSTSKSPMSLPSPLSPKVDERKLPRQFPCVHCAVKFSSLDNLQTHQEFYCTKTKFDGPGSRGNSVHSEPAFFKCRKCKMAIPEDQMTSHGRICGTGGNSNSNRSITTTSSNNSIGWKCPCCDVHSATVSAAQKHLETHTGIRAFKCLLCGYRGNTLRGMRTHIRTHFDKHATDILEGDYMACITSATTLDEQRGEEKNANKRGSAHHQQSHSSSSSELMMTNDKAVEFMEQPRSASPPQEDSLDSMAENNNRLHICHLCKYSSSYKGNVIRHMKLVHKISEETADEIMCGMSNTTNMSESSPTSSVSSSHTHNNNNKEQNGNDLEMRANYEVIHLGLPGGRRASVSPMGRKAVVLATACSPVPKTVNGMAGNNECNGMTVNNNNEKNENARKCSSRGSSCSGGSEEDSIAVASSSKKESGHTKNVGKSSSVVVKYCKPCDIYFNHLSSFVAHQKFYCGSSHVPCDSSSVGSEAHNKERAQTPVQ